MRKEMLIILLGIWVAVMPYIGIPASWRTIGTVAAGVLIILVGLLLRGEAISGRDRRHKNGFDSPERSLFGDEESEPSS